MGKALGILAVLVLGLGLAGFVNYQRNAALDRELQDRPYAGISDAELAALISAYEAEVQGIEAKLGGGKDDKGNPDLTGVIEQYGPSDVGGKVEGFEHFQRKHERWREVRRAKLEHEIELEKLRKERDIRARGLDDPMNRILRRVLTF